MTETKLFKKKYSSEKGAGANDSIFIGAQLPQQQFEFISLFSIVNGCSKSEALRIALDFYIEHKKSDEDFDINSLVNEFVHQAKRDFEFRKDSVGTQEFLVEIQVNLKNRGISIGTINKVLDSLNIIKK